MQFEPSHAGGLLDATSSLSQRMELRELGTIEDAPPTLSFDRTRHIALPWRELVAATETTPTTAARIAAEKLRSFIEAGWGFEDPPRAAEIRELFGDAAITGATYEPRHDGTELTDDQLEDNHYRAAAPFDPYYLPGAGEALKDGVFVTLRNGESYRLIERPDSDPFTPADFRSDKYARSWKRVVDAQLVVRSATTPPSSTAYEYIDLRAPYIERRYSELITERHMAARIVDATRTNFDDGLSGGVIDPARIEELRRPYTRAMVDFESIERELERLARLAAQMNYRLMVEPMPTVDENGNEVPAPKVATGEIIRRSDPDEPGKFIEVDAGLHFEWGRLYELVTVTKQWTPQKSINTWRGWFIFGSWEQTLEDDTPVSFETDVERLVDTFADPHIKRAAELRTDEQTPHEVFIFELRGSDYIAEDGTPLDAVMLRCKASEDFRLRTVVFLPDYEVSMTGRRILTGYSVFHRPAPGDAPIAFPELEVAESLVYKTTWQHTELGELVHTVNLAPGERREITISRSYERSTSETTSTSSVFDLTSSESSDLASEMERSTRNEMGVDASVGAKGSVEQGWGTGKAKGEVSASVSASVKQVGEQMAKSAQNAARSVNEQRRDEVTTSSTTTSTTTMSDVSVSTIDNINQGRTLNLMYYRLYNRFLGVLLVDRLQLRVRSGIELIAGSGLRRERTYSMHELDQVVAELEATPLPIELTETQRAIFRLGILERIGSLVLEEYQEYSRAHSTRPTIDAAASTAWKGTGLDGELEALPAAKALNAVMQTLVATPELSAELSSTKAAKLEQEFNAVLEELRAALEPLDFGMIPVADSEILVAANGLYLDSHVGARPSTEPYSEAMRDAEVAQRQAEIERIQSETERNLALASHIRHVNGDAVAGAVILECRVVDDELQITLSEPLGPGVWQITYGGHRVAELPESAAGSLVVVHRFDSAPDWLDAPDRSLLALVNESTGQRMAMTPLPTALDLR